MECYNNKRRKKEIFFSPYLTEEYPNYCGTMPMAVFTFLERYDFSGKTILPVCTNEGSGMGNSENDIQKYAPGAIQKKGLPINGSNAANAGEKIKNWLAENNLI